VGVDRHHEQAFAGQLLHALDVLVFTAPEPVDEDEHGHPLVALLVIEVGGHRLVGVPARQEKVLTFDGVGRWRLGALLGDRGPRRCWVAERERHDEKGQ